MNPRREFLQTIGLTTLGVGAIVAEGQQARAADVVASRKSETDPGSVRCALFIDREALDKMNDEQAKEFFSTTCGDVLFRAFKTSKDATAKVKNAPRGPDVNLSCTGGSSGASCMGSVTFHL